MVPWTEIESFNNVRKYTANIPEVLNGVSEVTYRAKIKLHGNNAGIQVHEDGTVVAQSRTTELSITNDLAGFAKWVEANSKALAMLAKNTIIFGEWCGPGIQSGVAINQIKNKVFAVFAARTLSNNKLYDTDDFYSDPELLSLLVKDIPDAYVIPWYNEITIDWSSDDLTLAKQIVTINDWVSSVEKIDPWVEKNFNIKGVGEGLVFYPVSEPHTGYNNFCNLTFKAKGEAHRVIKTKLPVQLNAEVAADSEAFAGMVLTVARLEQGARVVSGDSSLIFDRKFIKNFMDWIIKDVQKETVDELEKSGLNWKQVQKSVADKARAWYLSQLK